MSIPSPHLQRSVSHSSRLSRQQQLLSTGDAAENDGAPTLPIPSSYNTSSSMSQKTPTRSFHHRSFHSPLGPIDAAQKSSYGVREETAELASYALSDAASSRSGSSPTRGHGSAQSNKDQRCESYFGGHADCNESTTHGPEEIAHPDVIHEVSEPASPQSPPSARRSPGTSVLTEMIRNCPPEEEEDDSRSNRDRKADGLPESHVSDVHVGDREDSDVSERTALLAKIPLAEPHRQQNDDNEHDIEGQLFRRKGVWINVSNAAKWPKERGLSYVRTMTSPKSWDRRAFWQTGVVQPVLYLPAVILGILLNILDALSYGMILFPLGEPIFSNLGPDGISMFYVSCIISQLVFSGGGSIFKGGIGSEMIEVVPFFHKMAFTILAKVGNDDPKAVLATTILSYSISSILTGTVFFLMGLCKIGSLIGFFPRHILIGCIGGVGWFLVATGLEVSARLDGSLVYSLDTLRRLFQLDTIFLWLIPLILASMLLFSKRWVKNPLLDPIFFMTVPAIFYFFVAAIPDLNLEDLRRLGWVFEAPEAGVPFYHFYTLYDFGAVHWQALADTIPAMFALTFFGILHVPINVPALGIMTGEDNVNIDRELKAHGASNVLSGLAGSIQNYLVYTNSVLFIKSGGDSRVAGIMLAIATFGIMVIGPGIIGYIPIMVVGALIFLLGIDLLKEALFDTWGKLHTLEYITIIIIVVTMGAWDFVVGVLVGIVLACVNFVVLTSRKSAIRATYTGEIAGSTVRRNQAQQRYLRDAGKQTHVTKLAGFLFFGTIVSVENRIRELLTENASTKRLLRFLVFDLQQVTGVDFSAAEAFTRIKRLLKAQSVSMIMCGVNPDEEIGRSLRSVGLWDEGDVQIFDDLNRALEHCENELLKTYYSSREALVQRKGQPQSLDVRKPASGPFSLDVSSSSPRRNHLQQAAKTTLNEANSVAPAKWQNFKDPLPLILQTFQDLTVKNEDFWFRVCPFFDKKEYKAGSILYNRGDRPNGFYILKEGILRAEYDLPQGKYLESIVAGTTCGELPFFSETDRTATVIAERDCVVWLMDDKKWDDLQKKQPDVAAEMLTIGLKLTSERMSAITSYVLTTAA
ncbi:MAG: hypothetical protein M1827_003308 [Pycnora praestabilis]|nr:MAG: hypothetical protein M1827_003308 [Pycnora praestabilis]